MTAGNVLAKGYLQKAFDLPKNFQTQLLVNGTLFYRFERTYILNYPISFRAAITHLLALRKNSVGGSRPPSNEGLFLCTVIPDIYHGYYQIRCP